MGVFGQTPLDTKISGKGIDGVDRARVHDFTLTKPDAISKDINPGASRVLRVVSSPSAHLGLSRGLSWSRGAAQSSGSATRLQAAGKPIRCEKVLPR